VLPDCAKGLDPFQRANPGPIHGAAHLG
jgi:hypothetical protein